MTLNGVAICGLKSKQSGPIASSRAMKEVLPGVPGYRLYNLAGGVDSRRWTFTGTISHSTLPGLLALVNSHTSLNNGYLYSMVDNGGVTWANCQLTDYRPTSAVIPVEGGYLIDVQATIERPG